MRILIISPIRLYRDGLTHVLGRDERVDVTGAFATTDEALRALRSGERPDVVLLDMAEPGALSDMRRLCAEHAGVKVVALGVASDDDDVIACAEAGVAGYAFRDASIEELFVTVESAARGELRCSPEMAGTLLRRLANLARGAARHGAAGFTRREQEIIDLLEQGLSNKQIGARLFIEVATVKNHMHNILAKMEVRTRAEAAAKLRGGSLAGADGRGARPSPRA